jgi:hypothetical protein
MIDDVYLETSIMRSIRGHACINGGGKAAGLVEETLEREGAAVLASQ